jgi:hypothetical protein
MLNDMKGVEIGPKGMRRICQAPMRKRIRRKQIAEFIVDLRLRDGKPRQEGYARKDRGRPDRDNREPLVSREFTELPLEMGKDRLAQPRRGPGQSSAGRKKQPIQFRQRVHRSQQDAG